MSHGEADILDRIIAAAQERLSVNPQSPDLARRAREAAGVRRREGRRSLLESLSKPGVRIIAECKHRSPSAGWLRQDFDPVELAASYERGGAAGISVVTEPDFFAGQAAWIGIVRKRVSLPVLQKDFFIATRQIYEAVILGADAILLIARLLPVSVLREMLALAEELGLDVLLEAHDERDLERALSVRAGVVGINARDLVTFKTDFELAMKLAAAIPEDRIAVLESGVRGTDDVAASCARGVRRFLVGEHLLRAEDPASALSDLVNVQ